MSPSMNRNEDHASGPTASSTWSRLWRKPVEKLSSPTTFCPSLSSRSSRFEPMKPAQPVTSQVCGDFARSEKAGDFICLLLDGDTRVRDGAPQRCDEPGELAQLARGGERER